MKRREHRHQAHNAQKAAAVAEQSPKSKKAKKAKKAVKPQQVKKAAAKHPKKAVKPQQVKKAAAKHPKKMKPKAAKPFIKRFSRDLKALSAKADGFINKKVAQETKSTQKDVSILQHDAATFEKKVEASARLKTKMKELERDDKKVVQKEKRMANAMVNKALVGKHQLGEVVVP